MTVADTLYDYMDEIIVREYVHISEVEEVAEEMRIERLKQGRREQRSK